MPLVVPAARRRVVNINPSSASDVVELFGLNVTGGYVTDGNGGGISISGGQVTLSQVNVYSNNVDVSAQLLF